MNPSYHKICNADQARFLYRISHLSLLSAAYALYRGHIDLACIPATVFITSINYWRNPEYGWRRNLDIAAVHASVLYQARAAYGKPYSEWYYGSLFLCAVSYALGIDFQRRRKPWASIYAHGLLHIVANVGNFILYSIF